MILEPFAKLKAKGYQVTEWQDEYRNVKRILIRKGDIEVSHSLNHKDYENTKLMAHLEEHVDKQFEQEARKRVDDMANMYGLKDRGPQHLSYEQYDNYMRDCLMRGIPPDPYIRPMYQNKNPEPPKPEPFVPAITKRPKNKDKMLLVIKAKS